MKSVIIDSSSAILLYRSNVIPAFLKYCTPVIPKAVYAELAVPGHEGADLFADLCNAGAIKIHNTSTGNTEKLTGSLHAGEREVIALFREGKGEFIIIDDGRGSAFCRNNNIPYINALLAVKIIFLKQLITESEYVTAWRWLLANGRYSEKVTTWADNADEQSLAFFM